jgi:quercetin dioxygenase-like cupin family protein
MPKTSIDDEREYSDEKFSAQGTFRSEHSKVVCGYFEPEQFIPVHAPDSDVTVVVQRGTGIVRDGDEEHDVEPGDVVSVPAGVERGVRAEGERL